MEIILAYLVCLGVRLLVLSPLLWISGQLTSEEIGIKESFICILGAEATALPFYGLGILSEIGMFYVAGYFASLGVFIYLVMKATKADFFPSVVLMILVFSIIRSLITLG